MPPTLDPERWRRLEPILDAALDLPPGKREAYLDEACGGDDELRILAEQWLAECVESEDFLEEAGGAYLSRVIRASPFDPSALERVGSRLGAFRLLGILGQGGMGTVFLAERADGQYEQQVAVKVVHQQGLGSDAQGRFRFERQILARLEHPNIARLLDGGVDDRGAPFLVLEYVDGVPLDEHCRERNLGLEERLKLVTSVCRAVAYAHRLQVVHRDLKPSNILVSRSGQVKLLDFGVAELLDRPPQEAPDSGSGYRLTLGFAAPEILRGETATSASDLYSLGVLIYQLITGALPFPARDLSFEELVKAVSEDPVAPPSDGVAGSLGSSSFSEGELDAVVLQALAKDPADRPSSADALADELKRLMDGEPVQALPQTVGYLLRKRFQRHRWLWLAAGTLACLLLFFAGGWFKSRREAEQRAEIAREFAQEAERIEWFLRYAQSLPLHDIRRERDLMEQRLGRLETRMEAIGDFALGPGNFALGRGYAQLDDHEAALVSLEEAWDRGYRTSGAALAIGKVLGRLYAERLGEALRIKDPDLRAARKRELEELYRDRALEFLRQSGTPELESPSYLAGLIAFYDGRFEEAGERAVQAVAEAPWLHEGHLLAGDAALSLANLRVEHGEYTGAEEQFARAQEAYGRAQEMAPSDPMTYESSCTAWVHTLDMDRLRGRDLDSTYRQGREACALALAAQPDRPSSLLKVAILAIFRLQDPRLTTAEVEAMLAEALRSTRAALELAPDHAEAFQTLGTAFLSKAMLVDMRKGQDPQEDLQEAAAAYRRALAIDPGMATSYSNLGTSLAVQGGLLMARGEDPRAAFDEAIESYRQALARTPGRVALLNNLGNLYRDKGEFQARRGLDPRDSYEEALEACRLALEINPRMVAALNLRGALEEHLGKLVFAEGGDPFPLFGSSIASLEAALRENPQYFRAFVNLGSTRLSWARALAARGEDPAPLASAALRDLDRAAALGPRSDEEIPLNRSEAFLFQAELDARRGKPPTSSLRRALEVAEEGLSLRPGSLLLRRSRARGQLLRALLLPAARQGGSDCLGAPKAEAEEILEGSPQDASTRLLLAQLHGACASWSPPGGGLEEELRSSRRHLEKVPASAPLLRREKETLEALLRWLEAPDGSTGTAALERLQGALGEDPLARQRWSHVLRRPTPAPAGARPGP